jgi:flagellar biosynthesis anti-sigma factor FlgM
MKIDGNALNLNIAPAKSAKTDAARSSSATSVGQAGGTPQADTAELSSQAQLADRIRQAVAAAPAVRQDRVAAARQKLEAGQIGQDPAALANRLIDHMLEE